jgi:hypothetical protein
MQINADRTGFWREGPLSAKPGQGRNSVPVFQVCVVILLSLCLSLLYYSIVFLSLFLYTVYIYIIIVYIRELLLGVF